MKFEFFEKNISVPSKLSNRFEGGGKMFEKHLQKSKDWLFFALNQIIRVFIFKEFLRTILLGFYFGESLNNFVFLEFIKKMMVEWWSIAK